MATAAPHVKLLRQLSKAKDDYMSGAFDIAWDGGSATLFMVFGQPSHAVFDAGAVHLDGEAALDALLRELPPHFDVGDWRRAMSPQETLSVTVDDITEPLAELVGEHATITAVDDVPSWLSADDDAPDLGFDLSTFPLLPSGPALWPETPAADAALSQRLSSLPASLVVLRGPRLRAAGIVRAGDMIDAVWVDSADHARGETAAMALLGAREGQLAGFALDGGDIAEALPMLWRLPHGNAIDTAWVDAAGLIAAMQADHSDHALLINGGVRAVGLFSGGVLIAAYTSRHPIPVRSSAPLLEALQHPGTTLRVLQRAPQPPYHAVPASPPAAAPPPPPRAPVPTAPQYVAAPVPSSAPPAAAVETGVPEPTAAAPFSTVYDSVRAELIAIAVHWLGELDAAAVVECLLSTGPEVDAFMNAINAIRQMSIPGQEPGTVLAMARDMHLHAAEQLCGL